MTSSPPGAKRYKLYLMLNCFNLTDRERQLIDQRLRHGGASLVWMYAPGLFNSDRTPARDPAGCRQLLGFGLRSELGEPASLDMRLTEDGARWFAGFPRDRVFGSFERPEWTFDAKTQSAKQTLPGQTRLSERFLGVDEGLTLARFVDSQQPSIVARQMAAATDLWIGSVTVPTDLLRSIARRAGCHLFCDADEITYANRSFLAIHTSQPGQRTFHLRRPADVIEVFSHHTLGRGVTQFRDTIPAFRTRLDFLGDEAKWWTGQKCAASLYTGFLRDLRNQRAKQKPSKN